MKGKIKETKETRLDSIDELVTSQILAVNPFIKNKCTICFQSTTGCSQRILVNLIILGCS